MRQLSTSFRRRAAMRRAAVAALSVGVVGGLGFATAAVGSVGAAHATAEPASRRAPARVTTATTPVTTFAPRPTTPVTAAPAPVVHAAFVPAPVVHAPVVHAPVVHPSVVHPRGRVFATGNAELDAVLRTLPAVLFSGHATVHYGYNPVDCCHAGGYNPGPNDVWVSAIALRSHARLVYVTAHELGHSVHLHSGRGAALTAAVAGAPSVRPGSPWDVSEKVADCVAWALYPAETAASGITYWTCPDPWRSQVRAALQ
jgi:hypothetical protein